MSLSPVLWPNLPGISPPYLQTASGQRLEVMKAWEQHNHIMLTAPDLSCHNAILSVTLCCDDEIVGKIPNWTNSTVDYVSHQHLIGQILQTEKAIGGTAYSQHFMQSEGAYSQNFI